MQDKQMTGFEYHCREARTAIKNGSMGSLIIEASKMLARCKPEDVPKDILPYLIIKNVHTGEVRSIFA